MAANALEISPAARRDVVDWLRVEQVRWNGRLSEEAFLDRVVDLDTIPATDSRYDNARGDIWQHTINNDDWPSDWVYDYKPLGLLDGPPERFARFVAELVHPVVRPDIDEAARLTAEINDLIAVDKIQLAEVRSIGDKPVRELVPIGTRSTASSAGDESGTGWRSDVGKHLWTPGWLRLFVSHVSAHKAAVASLKRGLALYAVSGFVAHEDIEPSLEWQGEIERALWSMDALVAVVTPDFHSSSWTDQEVGFALGQRVVVIPLRAPDNPYGFMGKIQGVPVKLADPTIAGEAIVDALLRRPETRPRMRAALITALAESQSFDASGTVAKKLASVTDWSPEELGLIEAAALGNFQVSSSRKAHRFLDPLLPSFRSAMLAG